MKSGHRRAYIDWARGLAVLLMIEAHTVDAWTRASDRTSIAYRNAIILGGFAAPLFLWIAGLALVIAATEVARRQNSRAAAFDVVCRRGLEVFILAFLFRLQAFIVSPGGHPVTLFRVDILNIMGPALVAASLVWIVCRSTGWMVASYAALACLFCMAAPLVRTMTGVDRLPVWIQWYIRPAGEYTNFTAFPWAGFVFAGAAVGALLASGRGGSVERRLHVAFALVGASLIGVGFYTASRPPIYFQSSFWTTSPTYFAVRVGVLMLSLAAIYATEALAGRRARLLLPLERFGRRSLFIYWIHVELVYGYASWWIHGRLPLWVTLVGSIAFTGLMFGAIVFRDYVASRWSPIFSVGPFRKSRSDPSPAV